MWQVLLAAAIAGSGYVAKNILYKTDNKPTNVSPQDADLCTKHSTLDQETSVFRFSSACNESKNNRKKLGRGRVKGNGARKNGPDKKIGGELGGNQGKIGKKFVVSLKKRRTGRNAFVKCDSSDVKGSFYV
nr:protein polar localization during asymmetric division and redistribution [Tanacetum cinerariifolium]